MPAVFVAAHHRAKFGELVIGRILHEGGGTAPVEAHESLAAFYKIEERLTQRRIVEQHTHSIVEYDGVVGFQVFPPEYGFVVIDHGLVGSGALTHLDQRVIAVWNGGVAGNGLAGAPCDVNDQDLAHLFGLGGGFRRNRLVEWLSYPEPVVPSGGNRRRLPRLPRRATRLPTGSLCS